MFCRGYEVESWSRFWTRFWILSLVEMLMFAWNFEVDAWSRFWRWNLIKICVSILDMTSRCYFGKMNSILGSVVPLAIFIIPALDRHSYPPKINAKNSKEMGYKILNPWWKRKATHLTATTKCISIDSSNNRLPKISSHNISFWPTVPIMLGSPDEGDVAPPL